MLEKCNFKKNENDNGHEIYVWKSTILQFLRFGENRIFYTLYVFIESMMTYLIEILFEIHIHVDAISI